MKTIFDRRELDQEYWHERALSEAKEIHTNPKDKHRSFDNDLFPKTKRGHGAEQMSMKDHGHTDNTAKWQDTFNEDRVNSAHKVSVSEKWLIKTKQDYEDDLNNTTDQWHIDRSNNMAKILYGWINPYVDYAKKPHLEAYSNIYRLYAIWEFKKDGDNQWKGHIKQKF